MTLIIVSSADGLVSETLNLTEIRDKAIAERDETISYTYKQITKAVERIDWYEWKHHEGGN